MARTLRERGVTTLFALPGGHILPLLDACLDEDIRVIDTRHEGAAALAAEGLANGQIAAALHLSPKTVSSHLQRVYAKLDMPSRRELILRAEEFSRES